MREAAKDRVKVEVNKTIEEEVQPVTDTLISDVKKAIDKELQDAVDEETRQKAKDLLDEWNPFKKKKRRTIDENIGITLRDQFGAQNIYG